MKTSLVTCLMATLVLGACSHYSDDLASLDKKMAQPAPATLAYNTATPQDIAPAAGGSYGEFSQYLAREYYDMAKYENEKAYDYKAAKNYTKKAVTAAKGQMTVPSKVSAFDIPDEQIGELNDARSRLISALKEQNTPENAATLAKAQCRYECWLERAEEAADESHYANCKNEFEGAMASLMMPAAGTTTYDVGFGANSAIILPQDAKTIEFVAQFLNDPNNASYEASLTGFSAAATQGEYADQLVSSRVSAVRDALVAKGIAPERLKPLVAPTADAANAMVQVALLPPAAEATTPYSSTTTEFVPVTPTQAQPTPAPVAAPAPVYGTN